MSSFNLKIRNYRALAEIDWSPEGVCLLTGPNGVGKSTLLGALKFLRTLFAFGAESAVHFTSGNFRRIGLDSGETVEFSLYTGKVCWQLRFPRSTRPEENFYGEELRYDEKVILRAELFDSTWVMGEDRRPRDEQRCCARLAWDQFQYEWMKPFVALIDRIRIYDGYWLNQVKESKAADKQSYLHSTGKNIWSVLANWQSAPRLYRDQFGWVLKKATRAFPSLLQSIEFDRGYPSIYMPGVTDPADDVSPEFLADGLLTGLLHLTAVAGAKDGSIIAIDEVENYLHPHAIRVLLDAMEEMSELRDLTILLTTHSPVVLNHFNENSNQVYVLGHDDSSATMPASLSDLHDEIWLAQFKLGSSYEALRFGSPRSA